MRSPLKTALFAPLGLAAALASAACGSFFPDSAPITYWALRPAEVALTGVRTLDMAARHTPEEAQLAQRVRDDLLTTERFAFTGGVTQALLTTTVQALDLTTQVQAETAQQGLTTLTRYTRHIRYTVRGTLSVVDAMTSARLGEVRRDVAASHACGTATVPGMPVAQGDPDPSIFANSEKCAVSSDALANAARMLAQSLVPHYEEETAQLWTEDLEHAAQAVRVFGQGSWVEAEALLRVDLEKASAQPKRDIQARASYNLALLLNATGQLDKAMEQLQAADALRSHRAWELAELSIKRAVEADKQAKAAGYAPHHLPALYQPPTE